MVTVKGHSLAKQKDTGGCENSTASGQRGSGGSRKHPDPVPSRILCCGLPLEASISAVCSPPRGQRGWSPKLSISSLQFLQEEKRKHLHSSRRCGAEPTPCSSVSNKHLAGRKLSPPGLSQAQKLKLSRAQQEKGQAVGL